LIPSLTFLERAVSVVAPRRAMAMAGARIGTSYFGGQFSGARRDKTSMRNFNPTAGSADADSIGDLPTLRARSRDLARNAPIARGARNTSKTNIVGAGLRVASSLQREILGITDDAAEAWEDRAEVLFDLWASSKMASVDRKSNFYEQQGVAFTSAWDSGDCFAIRRYKESTSFLALCVQLVEADRVCTPNDRQVPLPGMPEIRDGVELDGDGEAIAYHVLNQHPGESALLQTYKPEDWARIPARGELGVPLMVHLMEVDRIGQTRGIPMLAPVIEALKQLDRYAEAELMAAVVSAFFTVFIKSTDQGNGGSGTGVASGLGPMGGDGVPLASNEMMLGSGTVAELAPGEDVTIANPNRPNPNFDPFFLAVIRQIGIALGIPYEVLIMHFSSSYTASKAAIETARQFFTDRRTHLARNFCQPVYEWFIRECVVRGIIDAPGFLEDPIRRAAWCGSKWLGRAPIVLDSVKDATAAEMWIDLGVETVESITTEKNGGDWWRNQEQRGRECVLREAMKIKPASPTNAAKAKQAEAAADKPAEPTGGNKE
jgi:lambda family phage portal protein